MFTVDEYMGSIKADLEKESALLIGNLKNVFTYKFASGTDLLEFVPSIEPTRFEVSIRMFSMDKDGSEVSMKRMTQPSLREVRKCFRMQRIIM